MDSNGLATAMFLAALLAVVGIIAVISGLFWLISFLCHHIAWVP